MVPALSLSWYFAHPGLLQWRPHWEFAVRNQQPNLAPYRFIPWPNPVGTGNNQSGNLSDQEIEHTPSPIPNSYAALATNSRQRRNAGVDFPTSRSPSATQPQAISSPTPSSPNRLSLPHRGQPLYESLSNHHLYSVNEGVLEQKPREVWDSATRDQDVRDAKQRRWR